MTDRELFMKVLDALEWNLPVIQDYGDKEQLNIQHNAITALRERLAQPEQEPFEYWNAVEGWVKIDEVRQHFDSVGCGTIYKTAGENRVPVYTTPPQRSWVGLTGEEVKEIIDKYTIDDHGFDIWCDAFGVVKDVEDKLRSKNT